MSREAPERVNGPPYEAAYASVRVFGPELDPSEVTRALRLPPDRQLRRGEPCLFLSSSGRVSDRGPSRHGFWTVSTESRVDSPRLVTHVEWLLRLLEERAPAVVALRDAGLTVDIFCYSFGVSRRAPPIPKALRSRAAALGIEISVDHYPTFTDEELAVWDAEMDRRDGPEPQSGA